MLKENRNSDRISTGSTNFDDIVFDCYAISLAWGYEFFGFYILQNGNVYTYDPGRDYWTNLYEVPDTLTGFEFKRRFNDHKFIEKIPSEVINEKIRLIIPASNGELSIKARMAYDAGCHRYVAYLHDREKQTSRSILLHEGGDNNIINTSKEANLLCIWLSELWGEIELAVRDQVLENWRNRALGEYPYLYFDAQIRKVRDNNKLRDITLLLAVGITIKGELEPIGVSVSVGEQESHWNSFLQQLVNRGLHGVKLVISDAFPGLEDAQKAILGDVPLQRCQFYLQQHARALAPKPEIQEDIAKGLRYIFDSPDQASAYSRLEKMVEEHRRSAQDLARWLEVEVPKGLTLFSYPTSHQNRLRNTNIFRGAIKIPATEVFENQETCLRTLSNELYRRPINEQYLNMDSG